ncbi:MAG: hypothetical protein NC079_07910 [Clostridium sp.]|nr:hypothetical protein [Acetatifactor muris]MCM1528296.1 hypothetical protein [Bacteroides sp.]MCM1563521.1 hypothetical protein [Clostridium sp.]
MGKYDDALYLYLSDNDRFADLFNAAFFHGERVLRGDMLESDSERLTAVKPRADAREMPRTENGNRDIRKRAKTGESFVVTAVENQNDIDYCMPWRIMRYDQMEYGRQIDELERAREKAEKGRKSGKGKKQASGGWTKRLEKGELLHPVYTVCFYHGTEPWDGPRSLKDMMRFEPGTEAWANRFHDYGMTLFCADGTTGSPELFHTDLRRLMEVLPLRGDREALDALWQSEEYSNLSRDTVETIAVMTESTEILEKLDEYENVEGGYSMCQAVREMRQDWKAEGRTEGKIEAILDFLGELGEIPRELAERIKSQTDLETLSLWCKAAARAQSLQQFEERIADL